MKAVPFGLKRKSRSDRREETAAEKVRKSMVALVADKQEWKKRQAIEFAEDIDAEVADSRNVPDDKDYDTVQAYELKPRVIERRMEDAGDGKEETVFRLPVRTTSGTMAHMSETVQKRIRMEAAEDNEEEEEGKSQTEVKTTAVKEEEQKAIELSELNMENAADLIEAKETLSKLALNINEDPEAFIHKFKNIRLIYERGSATLKKLALLTQLTVWRDLLPNYRIKPLTDLQKAEKVSNEVKRTRAYEDELVYNYRRYVDEILEVVRSKNDAALKSVGIACACGLVSSAPHFNYRDDLLRLIIGQLSGHTMTEDRKRCIDSIVTVFQKDEEGRSSLDTVRLIHKMLKDRHFSANEEVINTFLHLRALHEFKSRVSMTHVDFNMSGSKKGRWVKTPRVHYSQKQRQQLREEKKVQKELDAANSLHQADDRKRFQGETLKTIFVTYFQILKQKDEEARHLLGAALEGIASFAHLINLDFFGDLLEVLRELLETTFAQTEFCADSSNAISYKISRTMLLCLITAFKLRESQKTINNVDLEFFVRNVYTLLLPLAMDPHIQKEHSTRQKTANASKSKLQEVNVSTQLELLIRAIDSILFKEHSVPPTRRSAFSKRLAIVGLNAPEKSAAVALRLLERITARFSARMTNLYDTEGRVMNGEYRLAHDHPDQSMALSTTLWEVALLKRHYSPNVRDYAEIIKSHKPQ